LDSSRTGQCLPLNFNLITRMRKAANSLVSLATAPDHSSHRLTIDGRGVYSGFSLACALPPRTVMTDLQPSAVGHQARLLYRQQPTPFPPGLSIALFKGAHHRGATGRDSRRASGKAGPGSALV
jgi:hypothetical protein